MPPQTTAPAHTSAIPTDARPGNGSQSDNQNYVRIVKGKRKRREHIRGSTDNPNYMRTVKGKRKRVEYIRGSTDNPNYMRIVNKRKIKR